MKRKHTMNNQVCDAVTAFRIEDIEAWVAERYKTGHDITCRKA
jgi:hypothetical protein